MDFRDLRPVDCDIHPAPPRTADLLPYLDAHWREQMVSRGIELELYEGLGQDERGINRAGGPYIAWFKDPAGNILAVLQER